MVSVNLSGMDDAHVMADTCGENSKDVSPFITVYIGPLNIIMSSASQVRKLAGELHRAADKLEALPSRPPLAVTDDIQF